MQPRMIFFVFLVLGLQIAAAGTVFNLEDKIKAYAERLAQYYKTKVVWWDTHGEKLFHPKEKYSFIGVGLGGGLGRIIVAKQLERFKLHIKTGPVVYGNVSTTSNTSTVLCTEWIEASHGPVKTTFTKSKQHNRKSSWNNQLSISTGFDISLSAPLPMGLGGSSKYYTEMNLYSRRSWGIHRIRNISRLNNRSKRRPTTSAKIEWIVIDEVKEIPWTADITIQGWFAVCLDKQINGKYVHFPKITVLQDPDLKKNQ
uniref:Cytotoxin-like protein n=1 Tax=Ixodes ricinus TaxID=34613 RepID=V5H7D3_IXORI